MQTTFNIPGPFTDQTPFTEMNVWEWADSQKARADVTFDNYAKHIGFLTGRDILREADYDRLFMALDHWHRTACHATPRRLVECFSDNPHAPKYHVFGLETRQAISPDILSALAAAGWVYKINPETTYFQIVTQSTGRRVLFAKYQTILGSRPLCVITED